MTPADRAAAIDARDAARFRVQQRLEAALEADVTGLFKASARRAGQAMRAGDRGLDVVAMAWRPRDEEELERVLLARILAMGDAAAASFRAGLAPSLRESSTAKAKPPNTSTPRVDDSAPRTPKVAQRIKTPVRAIRAAPARIEAAGNRMALETKAIAGGPRTRSSYEVARANRISWARTYAGARARRLSRSQRSQVARAIANALGRPGGVAGVVESEATAASRVEDVLGRGSARRAHVIARTEMHTASMVAQDLEADDAGRQFGIRFRKVWRSANDARVRATHALLNGSQKAKGEPFVTAKGVALQFPSDPAAIGDPKLVASEVINCRCSLVYVDERHAEELRGAFGLPTAPSRGPGVAPFDLPSPLASRTRAVQMGDDFVHLGDDGLPRGIRALSSPDEAELFYRQLADEVGLHDRVLALPRELRQLDIDAVARLGDRAIFDPELAGPTRFWHRPPAFVAPPRPGQVFTFWDLLDAWIVATDPQTGATLLRNADPDPRR